MNKLFKGILFLMITSFAFAENNQVMKSNDAITAYIDKDSIKKDGKYYQATLNFKMSKPSTSKDGTKYDQTSITYKYDCTNSSESILRAIAYYQNKIVGDANLMNEEDNFQYSDGTKDICENYLQKDVISEKTSNDNAVDMTVDTKSIKKIGKYYQVLLVLKTQNPEISSDGVKYDQMNSLMKFDCKNNLEHFVRITAYYQGKQVRDSFNPNKKDYRDSNTTKDICKKYLTSK